MYDLLSVSGGLALFLGALVLAWWVDRLESRPLAHRCRLAAANEPQQGPPIEGASPVPAERPALRLVEGARRQ